MPWWGASLTAAPSPKGHEIAPVRLPAENSLKHAYFIQRLARQIAADGVLVAQARL